jgi:predicted dehydrogenase
MKDVTVALVGLGGYGNIYAGMLLEGAEGHNVRVVAGIDPFAERTGNLGKFQQAGIPVFADLGSFFAVNTADLIIISTGIHLHTPMTILALEHGANVLCEKPVCATLEDARRMVEMEKKAGKFVAIGYQWSYAQAIQDLKKDILVGKLGQPQRFKSLVLWPRRVSYYKRNDWAGKIRTPAGEWVLDSPLHNATAHYLHNLFFLLGDALDTSASLSDLQAECYRVNQIENFDAAALRCHMAGGVEVLYYAAHCVPDEHGPWVHLQFEKAVVEFRRGEMAGFTAVFKDGGVKEYGDPFVDESDKLWQSVDLVRRGGRPACDIRAALPQLQCIQAIHKSSKITTLAGEWVQKDIKEENDLLFYSSSLQESFLQGWSRDCLPAELGEFPWAEPGETANPGG